jgi:hypothetical protein
MDKLSSITPNVVTFLVWLINWSKFVRLAVSYHMYILSPF